MRYKMVRKFKKKELERLNCSEEEISLVLNYQSKIPILVENEEVNGFCVEARELYNQLEVKRKFVEWIKTRIKSYRFIENKDFITHSTKVETANGGYTIAKDYFITIYMAENLSLVEKTEIGQTVRDYFRLMRTLVKRNKEWWNVRDPEKEEYKKMSYEVDSWCLRVWNHHAHRSEYAVEADMLNIIVSGKTSRELKLQYGVSSNELIRDYLKKEHNEELLFLEQQNQVLLLMDMGFTERKNMLSKMHEVKFGKSSKVLTGAA